MFFKEAETPAECVLEKRPTRKARREFRFEKKKHGYLRQTVKQIRYTTKEKGGKKKRKK